MKDKINKCYFGLVNQAYENFKTNSKMSLKEMILIK